MSAAAEPGGHEEQSHRSVLSLIRALQSGQVAGLSPEDRRRVVEHLWGDGYSVPETAEIVKASERTILRDRVAIKAANAIRPDESFISETVGALVRQADLVVGRLRRIARDKQTAAAVKVDAEVGCWTITRDLIQSLQSLGYLPTAPRQFQGELTHRTEDVPSYDELQAELDRVERIVAGDVEVLARVTMIKDTVNRLSLGQQIKSIGTLQSAVHPESDAAVPEAMRDE